MGGRVRDDFIGPAMAGGVFSGDPLDFTERDSGMPQDFEGECLVVDVLHFVHLIRRLDRLALALYLTSCFPC
jgi:hypothetical protein